MTNKQKIKGTTFERSAVEILKALIRKSNWRRIPGSGALGTSLNEPTLTGDIFGRVESFPKPFKVEAKVGYGGKTQFSLKKEWLDKIREEASSSFSFPFLIGKFLGVRSGTQIFVVMDVEDFAAILNRITDLDDEIRKLEVTIRDLEERRNSETS